MLKLLLFQKEILQGYNSRRGNASRYPTAHVIKSVAVKLSRYPTPSYKICRNSSSRYPTPGYKFCRDEASSYPEHYFGGKGAGH